MYLPENDTKQCEEFTSWKNFNLNNSLRCLIQSMKNLLNSQIINFFIFATHDVISTYSHIYTEWLLLFSFARDLPLCTYSRAGGCGREINFHRMATCNNLKLITSMTLIVAFDDNKGLTLFYPWNSWRSIFFFNIYTKATLQTNIKKMFENF
jgi:hypothetical protein